MYTTTSGECFQVCNVKVTWVITLTKGLNLFYDPDSVGLEEFGDTDLHIQQNWRFFEMDERERHSIVCAKRKRDLIVHHDFEKER